MTRYFDACFATSMRDLAACERCHRFKVQFGNEPEEPRQCSACGRVQRRKRFIRARLADRHVWIDDLYSQVRTGGAVYPIEYHRHGRLWIYGPCEIGYDDRRVVFGIVRTEDRSIVTGLHGRTSQRREQRETINAITSACIALSDHEVERMTERLRRMLARKAD